jgi:hypothetical protein
MKLQEIFDQLSANELSQLSIGNQPQGVINERNQALLVNSLNLGLTNLHTRFNLKEGRLKLLLLPDLFVYNLKSAYAIDTRGGSSQMRYIEGSFYDDLAKVEQVVAESGKELPLNDKSEYACSTPSTHVLRVPEIIVNQGVNLPDEFKTETLDVVYRALHHKVGGEDPADVDAESEDIDLPYAYLEPLLYFIASRVHHPKGMSGDFQMGASYSAKYEQACQRLENTNLQTDRGQANTRLERNGWV